MEKKNLLAIILCVLFYFAYTQYLKVKYPHLNKTTNKQASLQQPDGSPAAKSINGNDAKENTAETSTTSNDNFLTQNEAAKSGESQDKLESSPKLLSREELTISNETSTFVFNQINSGIESLILKNYRVSNKKDASPVDLIDNDFYVQALTSSQQSSGYRNFHAERQGNNIKFWKTVGPWELSQTYIIPEKGYSFDLITTWKNISTQQLELTSSILMHENVNTKKVETGGGFLPGMPNGMPQIVNFSGRDDIDSIDTIKYCEEADESRAENPQQPSVAAATSTMNEMVHFYGFDQHYFQKVLLPQTNNISLSIIQSAPSVGVYCSLSAILYQPQGLVKPEQSISIKLKGWFGPKELDSMVAISPTLD
ncbi:MAG: membrane protein insertase YidC [Bdellovibrionota bacterium]